MRHLAFLLLVAVAILLPAPRGEATVPTPAASALAALAEAGRGIEPVCRGCGCRGGPGHRLANGKCASWGRRRR